MRLGKQRHESKYLAIEYFYTNNSWMCKQLGIARAAFYKWKHIIIPQQEQENQEIAELIKEYDEHFSYILGYRRMTDWINHFNQTHFSRKRVHRIMKKLGIHSVIRKKKKKYNTSKPEETAENKLARNFYAVAPNQKWATDVAEFKIPETGKKYTSVQSCIFTIGIRLHLLLAAEMIISQYLKLLIKQYQPTQMPSRFFIAIEVFSIQAGYSKRN